MRGKQSFKLPQVLHTEILPFAEFFEWWSNNCMLADDAISTSTYVGKISTYNSI
jgi:hypothetical protein